MGRFRSITNQGVAIDSTTVSGSVANGSSGNVTLISSGAASINVYAYSLSVVSSIVVSVRLMSGSTSECWRTLLTIPPMSTSVVAAGGIAESLAVSPPGYLFRTAPGDALTYEKGGSTTANGLGHYALAFWRG